MIDPFFVYLGGVVAVMLIGWLWLEYRWACDQRDRALEQAEEAQAMCERAIDFAADLVEAAHKEGVMLAPERPLLNHPPPRTTGPAFRRNGGHLKRVQ